MKCPICNSKNTLSPISYDMTVSPAMGVHLKVELDAFVCSHCGQETETPAITTENDLKIAKAKLKWHEQHISETRDFPSVLKTYREAYGITQQRLTSLFGVAKNAVSKYERREVSLSGLGERMIMLAVKHPEVINWLQDIDDELAGRQKWNLTCTFEHNVSIVGAGYFQSWPEKASLVASTSRLPLPSVGKVDVFSMDDRESDRLYSEAAGYVSFVVKPEKDCRSLH